MSNRRSTRRSKPSEQTDGDDVGFEIELKLDPETSERVEKLTRTVDGLADLDKLAEDLDRVGLPEWAERVRKIREGMTGDGDTEG